MINETLIEKYFSRSLTPDESLEFDKLYENDPNFKQEVDFLKNITSVSEIEDDLQFKSEIAALEAEFPESEERTSFNWKKGLIAAVGLLFIMLSVTFIMTSKIDENQLFSSYFEPSKNVTSPIVRSADHETVLNNAFIAYTEADYKQAIMMFQTAYEDSKNSELLFYEANALLAIGNNEKAIIKFEEHLNYSDILTNRSHWYLALAYLKTNQIEKAKRELKSLIDSGETFKKAEANSLLKKLD